VSESSGKVPHIEKIIVDASLFNEGTLCIGHKVVHIGGKKNGKHLDMILAIP
jgi:hypothetical protein